LELGYDLVTVDEVTLRARELLADVGELVLGLDELTLRVSLLLDHLIKALFERAHLTLKGGDFILKL
jgi:hypothetical protein